MKSEKAENYLDNIVPCDDNDDNSYSTRAIVETAVELAEQEMQEKAIEAHRKICPSHKFCKKVLNYGNCENSCIYMKNFINQLNKL